MSIASLLTPVMIQEKGRLDLAASILALSDVPNPAKYLNHLLGLGEDELRERLEKMKGQALKADLIGLGQRKAAALFEATRKPKSSRLERRRL